MAQSGVGRTWFANEDAEKACNQEKDQCNRLMTQTIIYVGYQIRTVPLASTGLLVYALLRMTAVASSTDRFFLTKRHIDAGGTLLI